VFMELEGPIRRGCLTHVLLKGGSKDVRRVNMIRD